MTIRLKDDFNPKAPISQVPATWFNSVAKFLNNIMGGLGIVISGDVSKPIVSVDPNVVLVDKLTGQGDGTHIDSAITTPAPSDVAYNTGEGGTQVPANQSNTWVRGVNKKGVKVNVFSRQTVRQGGTAVHNLYRTWEFDVQGRLVNIGEEHFGTGTYRVMT